MKIGVMSDTHGSLPYFEKALDLLKDCDVLFHIEMCYITVLEMTYLKDIILKA